MFNIARKYYNLFFGFSERFLSHISDLSASGFLRVGDAVTSENIIPTRVIACVFGQDYEITPISHDMMTLIYDPQNSDLLFYRGFAPGTQKYVKCYLIIILIKYQFAREIGN